MPAPKLVTNEAIKRSDLLYMSPYDLMLAEDLRGRHKAPNEDAIIHMAVSLVDHGQIQPVEARRTSDNRALLTLGFTRCAAARLIREGFTDPDGTHRKIEDFKLQVKLVQVDDKEAFLRNVVENSCRNQTSPIDDACNQERLRTRYGYTDAEIAKLYNYKSATKVSTLKRLLTLEPELQEMVHNGDLPVQGAIDLLDAPRDKRASIINAATTNKGKINGSEIKNQVREHMLNDDNRPRDENGEVVVETGFKPLSAKIINRFFGEKLMEKVDGQYVHHEQIRRFAKDYLSFVRGQKSQKSFIASLNRLLDAKR